MALQNGIWMNATLSKLAICLILGASLAQAYIVEGMRPYDGHSEFGQRGLPSAAYPTDNEMPRAAKLISCVPLDELSYWLCNGPPYSQAGTKFQQTSKRRNPSVVQFSRERVREDRPIIRLG